MVEVLVPPIGLPEKIRLDPAGEGRCGVERVPDLVVIVPSAEGPLRQEALANAGDLDSAVTADTRDLQSVRGDVEKDSAGKVFFG